MYRFKTLILFVLVAVTLPVASAQGVMTFETESHDFGTVTEGEKPTFTFRFTNTGDAPLTISGVHPSCGCTAPSYSTEAVAPEEMGEIVVEYDSEGRPGDFNKTIDVRAEDAANSSMTLRILGTVTPVNINNGVVQGNVAFDSDSHTISDLHADDAASHTFRMQNKGDEPLTISEVRVFNDGVEVNYPSRMIFPGEIVDVEIAVSQPSAALNRRGEMDVAIVLATNDTMQPSKSLRLLGRLHETEDVTHGTDTQPR